MHPALRTLTLGATIALVASGTVLTSVASAATPTATTACRGLTSDHQVGSENNNNGLAFPFTGRDHTWSGRTGGFDIFAEDEIITNNTGRTIKNAKLVVADLFLFRGTPAAGPHGVATFWDNSSHEFRVDSSVNGYDSTVEGADATHPGYDAYLFTNSDSAPFDYQTIAANGIVANETHDSLGNGTRNATDAVPTMDIGDLAPGATVTKTWYLALEYGVSGPWNGVTGFGFNSRVAGQVNCPTITSGAPAASADTTSSYSATVTATGDSAITYAIGSGALPDGLSLDPSTGVISGTPTAGGTFDFTIDAIDNWDEYDSASYSITVAAPDPTTTAPSTTSESTTSESTTTGSTTGSSPTSSADPSGETAASSADPTSSSTVISVRPTGSTAPPTFPSAVSTIPTAAASSLSPSVTRTTSTVAPPVAIHSGGGDPIGPNPVLITGGSLLLAAAGAVLAFGRRRRHG